MQMPAFQPQAIRRAFLGSGYSNAMALEGLSQQGCDTWKKIACGAEIAACAVACASGVGTAGCIACLGDSYDRCKDCF
jgi:hypothetical protein